MWRARFFVRLAAVMLLVCAVGVHAASAHDEPRTTGVDGTFTDPGFLTGIEGVSPSPPAVPGDAVFHGTSKVAAPTMIGDVSYTLWGRPNPAGYFDFRTVEIFQGWVAGCGTGTMSYTVVGTADPTANSLQGTWTVVADSGTEGLRSVIDGGGQLTGQTGPSAESPDPTSNRGSITGLLHCTGRPND
jgi:hypothetical protein